MMESEGNAWINQEVQLRKREKRVSIFGMDLRTIAVFSAEVHRLLDSCISYLVTCFLSDHHQVTSIRVNSTS